LELSFSVVLDFHSYYSFVYVLAFHCGMCFLLLLELLTFSGEDVHLDNLLKLKAKKRPWKVMRCAEIKRVLSDIFLFKNLNEVSASFWTFETIGDDGKYVLIYIYIYKRVCPYVLVYHRNEIPVSSICRCICLHVT